MRKQILLLAAFSTLALAQDSQSLGDIARQARLKKQQAAQTKTITRTTPTPSPTRT